MLSEGDKVTISGFGEAKVISVEGIMYNVEIGGVRFSIT